MQALGIPSVILFGLPETKDEIATGAWADDGIVQKATRAIKREVPEPAADGRCLPLRVHVARTLRHRRNRHGAPRGGGHPARTGRPGQECRRRQDRHPAGTCSRRFHGCGKLRNSQ